MIKNIDREGRWQADECWSEWSPVDTTTGLFCAREKEGDMKFLMVVLVIHQLIRVSEALLKRREQRMFSNKE
jgi:hypothetical protein